MKEGRTNDVEEKQKPEVDIAVFEAYYTEIAPAARLALANTVEKSEVVIHKAASGTAIATILADIAIMKLVDLLFFEPSVRLASLSYWL